MLIILPTFHETLKFIREKFKITSTFTLRGIGVIYKLDINKKIRELRLSKGISQVFIAKGLEISISAYNMKEAGKRLFQAQELKKVAKVLNEHPSVFLNKNSTKSGFLLKK